MLQLDKINTYYGESHILRGVSLDLPAGRSRLTPRRMWLSP